MTYKILPNAPYLGVDYDKPIELIHDDPNPEALKTFRVTMLPLGNWPAYTMDVPLHESEYEIVEN